MLSFRVRTSGPLMKDGAVKEILRDVLEETAEWGQNRVKSRTPVRTGRLKAGWNVSPTSTYIRLDNQVFYAPYVEARRLMAAKTVPEIRSRLRLSLSQGVKKLQ